MKEIGNRIRLLREQMRLTIREFAARTNLSIGQISEIESGKRRVSPRVLATIVLRCSANERWLLSGEGPMFLHEVHMEDHVDIQDEGLDLVVTNVATGDSQRVTSGPDLPRVVLPDHRLADLVRDLVEWWRNASDDERAWLRVQLRHTIPGFGKPRRGRPRKSTI